ncbi:MAG: phosphatase PAP2 family protein [Clostridia bacterium]|nr:phosphatase PAP2 family protein [Clostridia bacterium]
MLEGRTFFFPFEVSLMEWLQQVVSPGLMGVISYLSMFGEELVMIAILGFLYWGWNKELGKRVGLNLLVANVWNPMVKNIFLRRRPYFDHEGIRILRVVEPEADPMDIVAQGYSFPSGHSTCAFATYGSLAHETKHRVWKVLAVVLPLLVGFSRISVGAHYPTDVLVGWLLGAVAILLVTVLRRKIRSVYAFYGLLLLLTVPGIFYCRSADYFTSLGLLLGFMGATLLDERAVHFENTKSILRCVLRTICGGALFLMLNTLLKLPFSDAFLSGGTMGALLVRMLRYAVVGFLVVGVYPCVFRVTDRLFTGKQAA